MAELTLYPKVDGCFNEPCVFKNIRFKDAGCIDITPSPERLSFDYPTIWQEIQTTRGFFFFFFISGELACLLAKGGTIK